MTKADTARRDGSATQAVTSPGEVTACGTLWLAGTALMNLAAGPCREETVDRGLVPALAALSPSDRACVLLWIERWGDFLLGQAPPLTITTARPIARAETGPFGS